VTITLYEHPLSPYAQKVKISLREKGVEFTLSLPDGVGVGGAGGEFLAANPRAEVPALVDGDVRVFDSTIILEYVEDKWPTPPMLPKSPAERARVRMLEEVMDTHFEPINWAMGELNWFRRAEGALGEKLRAKAADQTQGFYAWLERELGGREWFNGEAFGWGDLSIVPYVNGSVGVGHPPAEGSSSRPGSRGSTPAPRWPRQPGNRDRSISATPTSLPWSSRACSNGNIATTGWNG
jgi:glutathione S-transferase/RNA polymerase-associated protein